MNQRLVEKKEFVRFDDHLRWAGYLHPHGKGPGDEGPHQRVRVILPRRRDYVMIEYPELVHQRMEKFFREHKLGTV